MESTTDKLTIQLSIDKINGKNIINIDSINKLDDILIIDIIKTFKNLMKEDAPHVNETIHYFNDETDNHITDDNVKELLKDILKRNKSEYVSAGTFIVNYHSLLIENANNRNILLKNDTARNAKILLQSGLKSESVTSIINKIMKVRAKQVLKYKNCLFENNEEDALGYNKQLFWNHIEKFSSFGTEYFGEKHIYTKQINELIRHNLVYQETKY
jgi:hypothetical protein